MKEIVYVMWHSFETAQGESIDTLVGVFENEESAQQAAQSLLSQGFFTNRPDNFEFDQYSVDQISWSSGFVSSSDDSLEA